MRAKKFFVNIGWAALYLSLILIVSTWASMVFTVGDAVARVISADGAMSDSSALMDAVLNDVYDMTDILQLMVYVTLLGMLAALLIAQQEKSLPRAANAVPQGDALGAAAGGLFAVFCYHRRLCARAGGRAADAGIHPGHAVAGNGRV